MSSPNERPSPMSDKLINDTIESSERSKRERRELIALAKQSSLDKEAFDIAGFGEFYSTRGELSGIPLITPEVVEEYEAEYYLKYPKIKSLQEYAMLRKELDSVSTN